MEGPLSTGNRGSINWVLGKVEACLEASGGAAQSSPRHYKNSFPSPPCPGSSLEAVSCPDLSLASRQSQPAALRAWNQQGKAYIEFSEAMSDNKSLPDFSFLYQPFCHNNKKSNCHGTCQLSVHCSPKHYFARTSVACSLTICKYLLKRS